MSKEKFSWRTTFNFQLNRNKIKHLYGDMDENGNELDDYENQWFIGRAIDEIWNYEVDGVYQADEEEEADKYRSEEHTSELQSLMRNSYAVFCLKKKTNHESNK